MDIQDALPLISELNNRLAGKPAGEVIRYFIEKYKSGLGFSTSLGAEDQVITQLISQVDPGVYIFTLDTGRMFPETYDLIDITQQRYKVRISVFFPEPSAVERSRVGWGRSTVGSLRLSCLVFSALCSDFF